MEHNNKVKDATSYSIDQIVELVINKYLSYFNFNEGKTKDDYYCGITNNLDKRMDEHRRNDFEIVEDKVFAWNCKNVDVAAEVEKRLGKLGFDIGDTKTLGNGGVENSTIVYLLEKGKAVNY
jgi:predicted GIY-YIG superfamily endonuclease